MKPERLDELLKNYRSNAARQKFLQARADALEADLLKARSQMVSDGVSLSQAITGMPHGSGNGDPTAKLATRLASGEVTVFVRDLERELESVSGQLRAIAESVRTVEIVLGALSDREREVLEMKIIDDLTWAETLEGMNKLHSGSYSKRSLQRLLDRAMDKAYEVVE